MCSVFCIYLSIFYTLEGGNTLHVLKSLPLRLSLLQLVRTEHLLSTRHYSKHYGGISGIKYLKLLPINGGEAHNILIGETSKFKMNFL